MTSGVYSIRSVSGKEYVGSSVNVEARWATHRSELNAGKHHRHALQKAWNRPETTIGCLDTYHSKAGLASRCAAARAFLARMPEQPGD